MYYKKELKLLLVLLTLAITTLIFFGISIGFTGCGTELHCVSRLFTSEKLAPTTLVIISILLSLTPLFFLREEVYKAWRMFAIVALPVIALLIFLAPTRAQGDFISLGYDREVASMFFSVSFLLVSWGISIWKTAKNKRY